jgi:hypothetical protein
MKTVHKKEWAYIVLLDESTGEYFIDVVCGGVATYLVRLKLTDDEVEAFKLDSGALDSLAERVSYSPDSFADRTVSDSPP